MLDFFSYDKYLYCTVMFWEGNLNLLQLNYCFWNIWVALKRALWGSETHPDRMDTEEAAAVEKVLWW